MTRLTIGIPTYNRADFLKRSLACALGQTSPDVEIIVSDNASTDGTAEVVRSFGDRVRYHRNPINLGATANFEKVFELASTDYFAWLQDDDLIHRDFASRALEAFATSETIAAYACFSFKTPSPTTFYHALLTGPAVPLRWMEGGLSVINGILVAPVSLFYSFGNPPALAYRTRLLRDAIRSTKHRSVLYDERIILAAATVDARIAVDPWPGAIFSDHYDQDYKRIFRTEPEAQTKQWFTLARAIGELLEPRGDGWQGPLEEAFQAMDLEHRVSWLNNYCPDPDAWRSAHPIAGRVRAILIGTIPESALHRVAGPREPGGTPPESRLKSMARGLTPPLLWDTLRSWRNGNQPKTN